MNKKIIIWFSVFLILLSFVNATDVSILQEHSDVETNQGGENTFRGISFYPKFTANITNVTVYPSASKNACSNFTVCLWHFEGADGVGSSLGQKVICSNTVNEVGDFALFPRQITLNKSQQYYVAVGDEAACTYTLSRDATTGFPEDTTYVYFNNSGYMPKGTSQYNVVAGTSYNIKGIGLQNTSLGLPPPATPTISINIDKPINGTRFGFSEMVANNSIINITFTTNESGINNVGVNDTRFTLQSNTSTLFRFTNNTEIVSGFIHLKVNANKTGKDEASNTTIFSVDPIYPIITTLQTNATIINNGNLSGVFTFTDDFSLWSYNFSIDGIQRYYKDNIVQTSLTYNLSYYVGNLSAGNHTLSVTLADGHTKNYIKPYNVDKGAFSNKLKYTFNNGNWVDVRAGVWDVWDTTKKTDRYTFDFMPLLPLNNYDLTISSSTQIDIIDAPDTPWVKWLIIDGHWMDFVMPNEPNAKVSFVRQGNNEIRVQIRGVENPNKIQFNSVGDLNIIKRDYNFAVINITTSFEENVLEQELSNLSLVVTRGGSGVTTNTSLWFNDVLQTGVTKVTTNTTETYYKLVEQPIATSLTSNYVFNWSIDYGVNNTKLNGSGNVYKMIVGQCNSTLNETAINFSVKDADTDAYIDGFEYEASFVVSSQYNPATPVNERLYAITNNSINKWKEICIYPWFARLSYTSDSLFNHPEYDDTHYITSNVPLNSSTQNIEINLVNSSLATAITIKVIDENGAILNGYIIEAYRFNLGTGDFTLITTQYSDSNGEAIFYLDTTTYEYRFIVKNPSGEIVHTEPKQKLYSTSYTLKVVLGSTPEVIVDQLSSLPITITSDRLTKVFNVTWGDISGTTTDINLSVYRGNATDPDQWVGSVSSTTLVDSSMTYTITDDTDNQSITYVGKVYVTSSKDGNQYYITSATMDFNKAWEVFGTEAIVMAFLFIATLTFIGAVVSPILGILLTIIGMLFTWWMGFYVVAFSGLVSIIIMLVIIMARFNR